MRILTEHGALKPVAYSAASLAEAEKYATDGVYTVSNTFDGSRTLLLNSHLDRLEESARRAGIVGFTLDRPRLRAALREMIAAYGQGEVRFRVSVSSAAEVAIAIEPLAPPPTAVRVATVRGAREDAKTKSARWMRRRADLKASLPEGVDDAVLVAADDRVLETLSANFFVVKDGLLCTATEDVLEGIARRIVLALAPDVLPTSSGLFLRDLAAAQEAFLTSSSRGIVPVVEIDGRTLGDGSPGPYTRRLRELYRRWVADHLEEL